MQSTKIIKSRMVNKLCKPNSFGELCSDGFYRIPLGGLFNYQRSNRHYGKRVIKRAIKASRFDKHYVHSA